ncbi:hypothetical protein EBE87_04385 [Pseudoroseomonas wenyumeiae]|uniref:DUF2939 domain-containing protein n=1 Tax=Teichococcus wenyumeiae TaxID=2478470 RepID=A0A3A9JD96_9PROT|nr:hypothetical protein [Pseudoroseomonas wenyumeiae]RKK01464.1 hypothetical protein D6Z83_24825 [Pseudoroseomonas wenyumeiae]RMI26513.1 hypothetical protein EBE87_04385 [Pseudoroseomonas wenyumeiae]
MTTSVDPWDEIWDAYEARRAATPTVNSLPPLQTAEPRRPHGWLKPLLAVAAFGLGCAAGSAWPVLNLYGLVLRQDVPALLRQLDLPAAGDGLREELRMHAGLRGPAANGAERLLAGMAEDMAAALVRPAALEQVLLAHGAPPLQLVGWGGTVVELALREGAGGFRLELVWTGQSWRAAKAELLRPAGAAPLGLQAALPLARPPG